MKLKKTNYKRLLLFIVPLIIFSLLCFLVCINQVKDFDSLIQTWIHKYRSPLFDTLAINITKLANVFPVLLICLLFYLFNRKQGIYVVGAVLTSTICNLLLKIIVSRDRPALPWLIEETGFSFPSGHAMASMALYGMILYFICQHCHKKLTKIVITLIFSGLILVIGLSRIYVGVHYPSDVLAGFCLSFCIVLIFIFWYQKKQLSVIIRN